jgi:tetratricopeptide (TPR) repeat protein
MTQYNLGNVLRSLGDRESGTTRLEEAVAAYRAALEVYTREAMPTQWATAQNNLAGVLKILGERERNMSRLQEARTAILGALEVADRPSRRGRLKDIDAAIAKLS